MRNLYNFLYPRSIRHDIPLVNKIISNFYSSRNIPESIKKDNDLEFHEGKGEWNILASFATERNSFLELHRYNPFNVTKERVHMWKERKNLEFELIDQKYIDKRHDILGNDLATAHFIVFRGGRVKFLGQDNWIKKEKDDNNFEGLPKRYVEGWFLEELDASGLPLRYEGFVNLAGLYELKTLILRDCPNIDDWCVDRISNQFMDSLEHLDLSGCNISERSLSCLYRCKALKTLVLENTVKSKTFEFACLLLEDVLPNLTVKGVTYLEPPAESENP